MAIKADKIEVIEVEGEGENKHPIHTYKWVLVGVLLPVAGVLYGINKRLNDDKVAIYIDEMNLGYTAI